MTPPSPPLLRRAFFRLLFVEGVVFRLNRCIFSYFYVFFFIFCFRDARLDSFDLVGVCGGCFARAFITPAIEDSSTSHKFSMPGIC